MMKKTRVLIVDDSIFFRKFLTEKLSAYPNIEIAGHSINAMDAKFAIPKLKPDVVTLDVEMPGMSGIELLKHVMSSNPLPVLIVSAVNMNVFDALQAGAVDFVKKPDANVPEAGIKFVKELAVKIEIAKSAKVHKHEPAPAEPVRPKPLPTPVPAPVSTLSQPPAQTPAKTAMPAQISPFGAAPQRAPVTSSLSSKNVIIALGASTGGTEATLVVLKELPRNTPGIVIVQHMPPGFTKMYADRLNGICQMEVREAKDGDRVEPGVALIAPGDMQLQVKRAGSMYTVKCYFGEKVSGHCPSVDVMFQSVAEAAGRDAVGIIMTGMGRDGADGLLSMRKAGAYTIGQDEESCVVYGMPMVAFNIGAVIKQAPCQSIASILKTHLTQL